MSTLRGNLIIPVRKEVNNIIGRLSIPFCNLSHPFPGTTIHINIGEEEISPKVAEVILSNKYGTTITCHFIERRSGADTFIKYCLADNGDWEYPKIIDFEACL